MREGRRRDLYVGGRVDGGADVLLVLAGRRHVEGVVEAHLHWEVGLGAKEEKEDA